jgi:alcohol dehydrogenase
MTQIPEYFEFQNPTKIAAGLDALSSLPGELEKLGIKTPLVITDKGIVQHGLLKKVTNAMGDNQQMLKLVFDDVPPDSSIETVNSAAKLFRDKNCDGIIAVGGGSVIDTAKGVNIVISENTSVLMQFRGHDRLKQPQKPLVVIPTTSGTGSEVTLVAVVSNPEKEQKMLFTSSLLQPSLTLLDPEMTVSLPPHLTAATGMDALTHAIEAYSCLQKNPFSDAYAQTSIQLVSEHLTKVVKNGNDKQGRYLMAFASTAAGVAFSNSMVGAVHGLGHTVGAISHVHHGMAMAILLPHVMQYNLDKLADVYADILPWLDNNYPNDLSKKEAAQKVIDRIYNKNKELNKLCKMPISLSEAGVKKESLQQIAKQSLNDGAMIANPKEIDADDALKILEDAF